ncbi:MAG: Hpt domain-containing protein, partial [Pseudomonadales bacterium]
TTVVGELAWAIEDMLNRVLDNTIEASAELFALLDEVIASLPDGVEAFRNLKQTDYATEAFTTRANTLAKGESLAVESAFDVEEVTGESVDLEALPDVSELEAPASEVEPSAYEEPSAGEEPSANEPPPIDTESFETEESFLAEDESLQTATPVDDESGDPDPGVAESSDDEVVATAESEDDEIEAVTVEVELPDLELVPLDDSPTSGDDIGEQPTFESETPEASEVLPVSAGEDAYLDTLELDEEAIDTEGSPGPTAAIEPSADDELASIEYEIPAPEAEIEAEPAQGETEALEPSVPLEEDESIEAAIELDASQQSDDETPEQELIAEAEDVESFDLADFDTALEDDGEVLLDSAEELPETEATEDGAYEIAEDDFDISELEAVADTVTAGTAGTAEDDSAEVAVEVAADDPEESIEEFTLDDLSDETLEAQPVVASLSGDSELDLIFLEEAAENFAVVQSAIENSQDAVDPDAVAAFHTLKGSSAMAEVSSIATIAAPLESLLANLLATSQPMNESVRALMSEGLAMMQAIATDLQNQRDKAAPHEQFANKVTELTGPLSEPLPTFDFERVRKLGQAEPVLQEWQPTGMGALQVELSHVIEQAEPLGHESIVVVCQRLLEVYQKLAFKPSVEAVSQLAKVHEILVIMFDELASSQSIRSADEALELLDTMDLDALIKAEAAARRLLPLDGMLKDVDQAMSDLQTEPGQLPVLQAKLSQLTEFADLDRSLLVTVELMLQVAEVIDGKDDGLFDYLSGLRGELDHQLAALRAGTDRALDGALESACRGALAQRQDTNTDLAPEVAESGLLPEDDIDPDVLDLFLEEAEELSEAIDETILVWSSDTSNSEHLDNLLRHLHTLKGGARLAGINSLGEFTHNFETYLIQVQQNPLPLDDSFFALLNERQDEITRRLEIYSKHTRGEASEEELASLRTAGAPVAAEADSSNEVTADEMVAAEEDGTTATVVGTMVETMDLPEDDIDEDILPIFIEEAEELVEAIDQCILDWSSTPDAAEFYDDLLRHLHTLKGGARLAGINSLGEFAHNFETYLIGLERTPEALNEAFFASLNQQQDEIHRRVDVYRKMSQGAASDEEVASLGQAPAVPAEVVSSAAQSAPEENRSEEATTKPDAAPSSPGSQEMVRVSAELLEDLISLAGESNITRGRVEQQIRDFTDSLQEMEDTINRVRDQVRRLEIEAESRETVFRLANEAREGEGGFDDLEMDRYTMIQEISRSLNESSSDMLDLKETLTNKSRDAETLLHQQARIGTELQEGLTRTRMVPFARLIPRLRRIVRQVSSEVGKSVRFDAFNVEGELDRSVLERIVAPLEHMLRNAVDHGIEDAAQRRANNKPETGRISLRLSREGGYVVLTISDDGGGINVDAVRKKAIERGVMSPDANLSDHDVMQFIMHAGFSTAEKLTQISGRGVGMDVVNSEIKQLGGSISIDSTLGRGSEFTIQIPFTVSINRALLVVVQEEIYAVPLNTIEGIVRVSPYELEAYYQPDAPMFEYAGQPYRLAYMGRMLERGDDPVLEGQVAPLPVILARSGDNSVALQVDRVIGSREIVSKSLGPQFNEVTGVSGATVMGDGSVVVILDVLAFIRKSEEGVSAEQLEAAAEAEKLHKIRKVMIVDDSVTVRKVTSRLMERQGWEVTTAKDGLDAMNQLQDVYPDIVLLDIEMPKMDGFEVLKSVRGDARLEKLPIIMITSRTGEKHKQQAFDLGVNQFLGKPFQENNLLSTIEEVLAAAGQEDG